MGAMWLRRVVLVCLGLMVFGGVAQARILYPKNLWSPTFPNEFFNSPDEAFAAYKAWEDNNNLTKPDDYKTIVVGYNPVPSAGTTNGLTQAYTFHYIRQADCPQGCDGNLMSLNPECPTNTTPNIVYTAPTAVQKTCIIPPALSIPDCPPTCDTPAPPPKVGNPIYPSTGLKEQIETDYLGAGTDELVFRRTYRSDRNGWEHNYQITGIDYSSITPNTPLVNPPDSGCYQGIGQITGKPYCYTYIGNGNANDFVVQRGNGRQLEFGNATNLNPAADINDRVSKVFNGGGQHIGWSVTNTAANSIEYFGSM